MPTPTSVLPVTVGELSLVISIGSMIKLGAAISIVEVSVAVAVLPASSVADA